MYNAPTQPYYRPNYNQPMYQQPQQMPQNWQQMPQAWQPQAQPEPMLQQAPVAEHSAGFEYQELTQAINRLCDILETMRNDRKEETRQTWTSDR